MAKKTNSFEGQELAPMEPWRPEYAPQAISSRRSPASTIVAFVLAAGFGLSVGGAFASQAGILPPLGGTETAGVADESPATSADPTAPVDVTPAPSEAPAVDPVPGTDPIVIPPPAGDSDDGEDEYEDEDDDEDEDEDEEEYDDEYEDEDEDGDDD